MHIKWREILDYKRELLRMLSIGTGWNVEKLDAVGAGFFGGASVQVNGGVCFLGAMVAQWLF